MSTDFPIYRAYIQRRQEAPARRSRNFGVACGLVMAGGLTAIWLIVGVVTLAPKITGELIELQLDAKWADQ